MKICTLLGLGVLGLCLTVSPAPVSAQEWAEKMFEKTIIDFGEVAQGSDVRTRIPVTSTFKEPLRIIDARTSCGCTSAKVVLPTRTDANTPRDVLLTHETAYIEVELNTVRYSGIKEPVVTVVFGAPFQAEVRIKVKANIRTDVVLTPGRAAFDSLGLGAGGERKVSLSYAGRPDWKVTEVINNNPHLNTKIVETARNGFQVNYDLIVTVKPDAPLGDLRTQLALKTNDFNSPSIPVLVEGRVEPEYSVSPEVLSFGELAPGEKRTMNVIIRGRKPFAIEKVESEKSRDFIATIPGDSRPIHILPLTVTAPATAGALNEEFTVTLSGSPVPVRLKVNAKITTPSASK